MTPEEDAKQRRLAKIVLVVCPISFMAVFAAVTMGWDPGIRAGHPLEYLQATCFLWALISTVLPILRLLRIFSLPYWFAAIIYGDMYLYVLSLCSGMYLNISWWGDLTHILSSIIVSGIVFMVLGLMHSRLPPHATFGGRGGFTAVLFLVSLSFGGIWEIMEGMTDLISGQSYMVYGAKDTLGDLTADLIGVTILSVAAYIAMGRMPVERIIDGLRFGKASFAVERATCQDIPLLTRIRLGTMGLVKDLMQTHREAIAYVFFGGLTTLFTWGSYSLFTYLGWGMNPSNILSWVCGVNFAFVVNKWYVFQSRSLKKGRIAKEYTSFVGSRILTGVVAWVLFPVLLWMGLDFRFLSIDGFVAKIIVSIVEIVLNWVLSKYFVFKMREELNNELRIGRRCA